MFVISISLQIHKMKTGWKYVKLFLVEAFGWQRHRYFCFS